MAKNTSSLVDHWMADNAGHVFGSAPYDLLGNDNIRSRSLKTTKMVKSDLSDGTKINVAAASQGISRGKNE